MGRILKFAMSAAYLSFGVMAWVRFNNVWVAISLIVCAIVFFVTIFTHASVAQAMKAVQQSDFDKARNLLDETYKFEWLSPRYKIYYHVADAFVLMHTNKKKEAIEAFENAIAMTIKNQNHRAEIHMHLAALYADTYQKEKSRVHLQEAKTLDTKNNLTEMIKKVEKHLRQ